MGEFTGNLDLRFHSDTDWELLASYAYKRDNGHVVSVDRGNHTDLASIPKFLRSWIRKLGKHTRASVFHDGGYRGFAKVYDEHGEEVHYNRENWDDLMLEIMVLTKEIIWKRKMIHLFIRMFGTWSYQG